MKTVLKWLGIGVSVLIGLIMIAAASAVALSNRKVARRFSPGVEFVAVPHDSAALARGRHLVVAVVKCTGCTAMTWAKAFIDNPALGHIPAPNITRGTGGRTASYTDLDWVRIIRHGVMADGRGAIIMPSEAFIHLSDQDLGAIIAYLKTVPAVNRSWPEPKLGPVGRILVAFTPAPFIAAAVIHHDRSDIKPAPAADTTAAYGEYLVEVGGCKGCHNPSLSGGPPGNPESPPAANLTPGGFASLTEADFIRVLREGKRPGTDQVINNEFMPWRSIGLMTDGEIHAVWRYLQSLPSKEMGKQ